ncbi:hypothetical protein [Sphingomonas sp. SRS2]|uniref:hypothetical protein n=1 Tax=Sphingomonas sp. SRS2 TaxID=133190 RepID=UPI0006184167|nr:hypothetical protein [Sphingomonas sp. SRS2]KKC25541.1 hypothetical protein WP12_13275 [Sphingomonas sp. SRS2]
MNMMRFGLSAVVATMIAPAIADARPVGLATTLRQMDAGFVCPQFLANDDARRTEISTFARTLAAKGLSFAQATEIRAHFLTRHNCNASIATDETHIQSAPPAITPIAVAEVAAPK